MPQRSDSQASRAAARSTNAATIWLNAFGCCRFQRWVAAGTICNSAVGIPAASSRDREILARSFDPQRTSQRRHRDLAQPQAQIDAGEFAQRGEEGALAAPAEILGRCRHVLSPSTGVRSGKPASERRLGSNPGDRPLQREPSRGVSEPGGEHQARHLSRTLQACEQSHDRPARDADQVRLAAAFVDRGAHGLDRSMQRERPVGAAVTG
jgi:hypothetical protein